MVDFNCCDHECVCQHNGHLEAAQQYSSILSKVMSKNANSEYVSKEDKDKWNNKANQDVVDLIKMMVEKHEEKLDELEEGLDKKVKLILYDLGFGDNILAKYATIEYVNELVAKIKNDTADLSKYALKTDLDTIKNDIQNKINNLTTEINNIKVTGGKDYSIESMEYKDNQLVLKQKNGGTFTVSIASGNVDTSKFVTKEQLAAELTKYAEINKLKRIRVKGNVHSLYGNGTEIIDIPTGGGGGGNDGKDGGYYKQYFKNNTSETVAPEKPTDGSAPSAESGWTENAVNRKSGEYTWMIQVFVSGDGLYGHYMTPICITGSKGDRGPQGPQGPAGSSGTGADTNDRDFRYYRTEKGHDIEGIQKPDGDNYYDWTDNPQGVGVDKETGVFYDNEWVCVRIKIDGVWGEWIGPVLWSHYGENGTDGDGVEYIFTKTSTGTPTDDPSSWYNNEQSKANGKDDSGSCSWEDNSESYYNTKYFNQDEYIKKNSGWFDDPSNIEDQHPGDKIWVSVRKKRNDSNPTSSEKEDAYWHQYSQPKIWSYYAKDGVVDAVIIDVVGETRYVYIDPVTKLSKAYNANVTVNMYNSGDTISKTLQFVSFKKSDGTDMSSLQSSFTFTNDAVAVNFAENALNFENDAYYTLTLVGTPQDMTDQNRYAEISFYGISNEGIQAEPGKNAVRLDLDNENESVVCDKDGNVIGNIKGTSFHLYDGNTEVNEGAEYSLTYSNLASQPTIDGNTIKNIVLNSGVGQNALNASITVNATYNSADYYATYTISKVLPGNDGQSAVVYRLEPSTNAVKISSDGTISPNTVSCKCYKQIGLNQAQEANNVSIFSKDNINDQWAQLNGSIAVTENMYWIKFCAVEKNSNPNDSGVILYDQETIPVVKDGEIGVGIESVNTYYGLSENMTERPAEFNYDTLSKAVIENNGSKYVWSADKVTYTKGDPQFTGIYCIGKCSDLTSVIEQYATSLSYDRKPQEADWIDTYPKVSQKGIYIWSRDKIVWKNGGISYSEPQLVGYIAKDGDSSGSVTVGLYTTASAISYQDGSFYPNEIGAIVRWGEGKTLTEYKPENPGGWQFQYKVDDADWTDMTTNTIQSQGENGISFKAHKDDVNLQEYVPIIKSGIDGLNGVTYMIDVSGMTLSYGESHVTEGTYETDAKFTVKLYKKEGNEDYVLQKTDDYECTVSQDPSDQTTTPDVATNSDNWYCKIATSEIASKSATIKIIITTNPGGAFACSMVIPISAAGKDGNASTGQTFKGSPLRIADSWTSGKKYYDGKRDAENGIFYQDVVLYNNMYYVCINTEAGESNQWKTAPDTASYWKVFAVTENFVADKIISNQAYIKELSSNEIVIFDGGTIVAGMTSSKTIDSKSDLNGNVTKKGDVRIWAGGMQKEGDLTSAPFTVTDAGVLKCQSAEGNSITLQDGTIYFNINGSVYHLGITNDKPDWINSNAADSTETWYQKIGSDTNLSFSQVGAFAIKDNKYYTDATMKTPVSGTYYKKVDNSTILYQVGIYTFLTYGYLFGVEVYNKASFTNGTKNMQGTVATTGSVLVNTIPSQSPSGEIGGTLNVITTNKSWAKISKVDKPTGVFTYYIADTSGSSSDSIPYTRIKQDGVTFNYNTNNGIYVMSASDTEIPNLSSMLSSWRTNVGTGISDVVYEIRNNNLTGGFIS